MGCNNQMRNKYQKMIETNYQLKSGWIEIYSSHILSLEYTLIN